MKPGPFLSAMIMGLAGLFLGMQLPSVTSSDIPSPQDHIDRASVLISSKHVTLNVPNAFSGIVADTKSMDPLLDAGTQTVLVQPNAPFQINVGDIIVYTTGTQSIIHRVVGIDYDDQGLYYSMKGDNNTWKDPEKVRFEQIQGIVVAIVY